ncbi:hypothetical protein [Rufibacter tibetensis]|uniref:Uncharacterized protein n=1 Tax=Rufibacter tibetensis TaxID=512763 RepID=A0A0P0CPE7_9BACT|nr:hypothetical protein [Rufibacter tibetensis]ALI99147.1 hypothetical protein DC20_09375 [Rufibacter tibetensis]
MEILTNPNPFGPAPARKGKQLSFFGVVFTGLMVLFLAGILYFTQLTDFSSPQVTSSERMENLPTVQNTRVDALVASPSIGTTANMASHAMFAPLLGQQPASTPLIFK